MGPDNPLAIMDVRVKHLRNGIRRTDTIYPDGVEIEFAFRMPTSIEVLEVVHEELPQGAFLIGTLADVEEDGWEVAFCQWWVMCTGTRSTCPAHDLGVTTPLCKLVVA